MRKSLFVLVLLSSAWALLQNDGYGQATKVRQFPLTSTKGLELVNAEAEVAQHDGRTALHLRLLPGHENDDGSMLAIISDTDFKDGTIEIDVAGDRRVGSPVDARGFIGIAFRMQAHDQAEYFYLRPTNARCDDQLRRNHSTQYISDPDYPWERLRKETPGVYESYVDLVPGAWTKMKIVVSGTKAQLYVNGAEEPCLIVNDLKRGESHGQIALWAHTFTDGYFSNLRVH
jgi:Domain of Unknown Function (DUF1080)